tara:strand:- start:749 stop:967 length:219 start_codon:yes stop_codon:yes gene_type:complete
MVCRRAGEAHHLQFAEKRGVGYKTGDNWVVPLCRHCHIDLHAYGNERVWWALNGVDAKEWAYMNWQKYGEIK